MINLNIFVQNYHTYYLLWYICTKLLVFNDGHQAIYIFFRNQGER